MLEALPRATTLLHREQNKNEPVFKQCTVELQRSKGNPQRTKSFSGSGLRGSLQVPTLLPFLMTPCPACSSLPPTRELFPVCSGISGLIFNKMKLCSQVPMSIVADIVWIGRCKGAIIPSLHKNHPALIHTQSQDHFHYAVDNCSGSGRLWIKHTVPANDCSIRTLQSSTAGSFLTTTARQISLEHCTTIPRKTFSQKANFKFMEKEESLLYFTCLHVFYFFCLASLPKYYTYNKNIWFLIKFEKVKVWGFYQICSLELKLDYDAFGTQRLLHIATSKKLNCLTSAKFSQCHLFSFHLIERFNFKMSLVTFFKNLEEEKKPTQI